MTKILLSQDIHPEARKILDGRFEIVIPGDSNQETLMRCLGGVEGIILRTNVTLSAGLIAAAPDLKIISRTGAGVDNVDIAAATERGILVCNTPAANNLSVAEHTVALILCLAKDLAAMDKAVRNRGWKLRGSGRAIELEGKTLGIIGMGRIGSSVAKKCSLGLGMKVLAHDPYAAPSFRDEPYEFSPSPERVFAESDFVSLHCPNLPETKGMVNRSLLGLMKSGAFLINCARGEVVDETALYEALAAKRIAGAALDVFSVEPPPESNPLLALDNVILSPHSAGLSREASVRVAVEAARAAADFFDGKKPAHIYNEKDLGKR